MGGDDFFSLLQINLNIKLVPLPEEKGICVTFGKTVQLQNASVHDMPPGLLALNGKTGNCDYFSLSDGNHFKLSG